MSTDSPLIECVPNVSEGRNLAVLNRISKAIRSVDEVSLLHRDIGEGANRTVFTFAGPPSAVVEAAFRMYVECERGIDMRLHKGTHPRQGAVDVCPLVPLRGISLEETSEYAKMLAQRVGDELGIPGWLYEASARKLKRSNLADIRAGEYESLKHKVNSADWELDFGSFTHGQWQITGTTVIGARNFLVAYNVDLNTNDVDIAQRIAENIRERGRTVFHSDGRRERVPGKLKGVKAIGWVIPEYGNAQVSCNIVDIAIASPGLVYKAVLEEAQLAGVELLGSELIGLIPQSVLVQSAHDLGVPEPGDLPAMLNAVHFLNLGFRRPFDVDDRVIERVMEKMK